ncbi:LysR substrate-binding domain-containing protein [uncultured Thalassospira sp.]|jgi:DNA-binding transcriptional LysR family regulator|uniref:LysR substrate-binding domain-containing protein n=1 Tax=uncultured Thalassospira sp. TaxID=404382 RepID=UPI0030DA9BD2|tara:strand:+ start:6052 stop:6918 length:867 start_codon:yes stop_codon:yes gene_type:complete
MKPAFDIDALRAIVTGNDLGSFTRAAIHLGRSQSAISMQLKKLEHQTGQQLFIRKGRGLVPTEAGETFVAYARQILALNDEAAFAMGTATTTASIRLGLPQDFFDDVMPATLTSFAKTHDTVHIDVRAGENHSIAEEVRAGRLDVAIAFFNCGSPETGDVLCKLPMRWLAHANTANQLELNPLPLVLFNHPCLFRQAALAMLEQKRQRWRAALTTPSLPGIWAALRSGLGVAVRTEHGKPKDITCADNALNLPRLPEIEVRLLCAPNISALAKDVAKTLRRETLARVW